MSDSKCISWKCKLLRSYLAERFGEVVESVSDAQEPVLLVSVRGRNNVLEIALDTITQEPSGKLSKGSKAKIDNLMILYLTPSGSNAR